MKYIIENDPKLHLRSESGSATLLMSMMLSSAILAGVYAVNDKIEKTRKFENRAQIASSLADYSIDTLELAGQLIQSGVLKIDSTTSTFMDDSPAVEAKSAGGLDWKLSPAKDKITMSFCNPKAAKENLKNLLEKSKEDLVCDRDKMINVGIVLEEVQIIDNILANGTTEQDIFAKIAVTSASKTGMDEDLKRERKARIKLPPLVSGECPFVDPEKNPPIAAQPFTAPHYVVSGRGWVGWVNVAIPDSVGAVGGYSSLSNRGELTVEQKCGDHACRYWVRSSADVTVRSWRVVLDRNMNFGMRLHIPNDDPGSCYVSFSANRRPKASWNSGCFAEDTMIRMADKSLKEVQKIQEGDRIYNPVTRKSAEVKRTIAGPESDPLLKIYAGGSSVTVSTKHPFQTKDGLKAAEDLNVDDEIIGHGGRYKKVSAIDTIMQDAKPTVYNFALVDSDGSNENHMVEADGFVTGDLFLQERVSGLDPTKRPTSVSVEQYREQVLDMMRRDKSGVEKTAFNNIEFIENIAE